MYAGIDGDYGEDHPYGPHEAHLERGTVSLVTVGAPPCSGQVTLLMGNATVTSASGSSDGSARFGGAVRPGDVITLGDQSYAEITLPDGSQIRIAPNTTFQFDEVLCEPVRRSFSGRLLFGTIWSKVTTVLGGEGKFRVTGDPDATYGVRGTIFTVETDRSRTVFRVFPEPGKKSEMVVYTNLGDSVSVREGHESVVERGMPAGEPRTFKPQTIDRWWEPFDTFRAAMTIDVEELPASEAQDGEGSEE